MKKKLTIRLALLLCALPATAQNWSIRVRSGAFVFGDFLERHVRPVASDPSSGTITLTLSAATRPGLPAGRSQSICQHGPVVHRFAPRQTVDAPAETR